jgi:hypothetical protein
MARSKVNVSLSASKGEFEALVSILVTLVLAVNDNDVKHLKPLFKTWVAKAEPVMSQLKLKKQLAATFNKFLLKAVFDDEAAVTLGKLLYDSRHIIQQDASVPKPLLNLYEDCIRSLYKDSMPAWNRIEKNVSILKSSELNRIFLPEEEVVDSKDLKTAIANLKKVSAKLTGRTSNPFLNPRELMELKESNPKQITEYGKYVKIVNAAVKKEVLKFVRASGNSKVPIVEMRVHLEKKGLINNLPVGFQGGLIAETGKCYTKEGRQLDKIPFGTVVMNPKYDPSKDNTYVFHNPSAKIRYRTLTFLAANKQARHSKVREFFEVEKESRQKWVTDLSKAGSKEQILAAMVEILYQTSCRIGGKENKTKGEPTYGLTTLQVKHMTINPGKIELDYAGKKLAEQHHVFKTNNTDGKKVESIIKALTKGKKSTDLVFTYKGKPFLRQNVNKYLRSLGVEITAHRFRQLAGTRMALSILKKSPFKASQQPKQAAVEKWMKEELKKVGELLHHTTGAQVTGMTAVKSYIDPGVLETFYNDLKLRIPDWIPTGPTVED